MRTSEGIRNTVRAPASRRMQTVFLIAVLLVSSTACDTTPQESEPTLVVEAFFDADAPLPPVRVSETVPVSRTSDTAGVDDAVVTVRLADREFLYRRDVERATVFIPAEEDAGVVVTPGSTFRVTVSAGGRQATAAGLVPPRIDLTALGMDVPDEPVSAVFVDTLEIGLDSLNLAIDAREGYIYPISVSVRWKQVPRSPVADGYWIQARLIPRNPFSSSLIDFFLLPEQIFREDAAPVVDEPGIPVGTRTWSGVYAVPVDRAHDPVPEHVLRVAVLRSTADFARFATSKTNPGRREPVSNVTGGIGFVAGISIDSVSVTVK